MVSFLQKTRSLYEHAVHVYLIFMSSLFLDCSSNRTKTSGVTINQSKKYIDLLYICIDFHFILIIQIIADNDIILSTIPSQSEFKVAGFIFLKFE